MKIRSRKVVSIILTLSLLVTLLLPLATPAAAASTYSAITTPSVSKTVYPTDLGAVLVTIPYFSSATTNNKAVFSFPTSVTLFPADVNGTPITTSSADGTCSVVGAIYYLGAQDFRLELQSPADENDVKITVPIRNVQLTGASGDITVSITSLSGQLSSGTVVVAKAGDGAVNVGMKTATDKPITENTEVKILVQETQAVGMKAVASSLTFKLPVGFKWVGTPYVADIATGKNSLASGAPLLEDGIEATIDTSDDSRKLVVKRTGSTLGKTVFQVVGRISPIESTAKYGDVVATVGGDSDYTPGELTVGKYAQFGAEITAKEVKTIYSGSKDQEIGGIYIQENVPGTLITNRSITLTLPSGVKWDRATLPQISKENDGDISFPTAATAASFIDDQTLKLVVTTQSSSKATKLLFKNMKVKTAVDFTGDVKVEIAGTATASGTVKVAESKARVTAAVYGNLPNVIIGEAGQAVADFSIVEGKKEAIDKAVYNELIIESPSGVRFDSVPTVEVSDGDIQVDKVSKADQQVTIQFKSTSSKPSTLKVSGVKLIIDRTVPVGAVNLKVKGKSVNETSADFANAETAATVQVANCVTPAPGDQKKSAKFVIGDTKFTVGGEEFTMDVAPYVKDGRTYLPVRFVAQALGVSEANIIWDEASQKVTLIKGDKIVQVTIGSKAMLVNGITINMDVPAEITSGRTMLPFRFIAQAFGATVGWDEATQTVSMDL